MLTVNRFARLHCTLPLGILDFDCDVNMYVERAHFDKQKSERQILLAGKSEKDIVTSSEFVLAFATIGRREGWAKLLFTLSVLIYFLSYI